MVPKIYEEGLLEDLKDIFDQLKNDGLVLFENQASTFNMYCGRFDVFLESR